MQAVPQSVEMPRNQRGRGQSRALTAEKGREWEWECLWQLLLAAAVTSCCGL